MSLSVPSTITLAVLGQEVAVVEECVYLGSLVHSSTLSLFGHIARMPDETYARSNNNKRQFVRRRNMSVDITRAPYRQSVM